MGEIFRLADRFMPRFKRRSIVTRLSRAKGDDISHFAQAPTAQMPLLLTALIKVRSIGTAPKKNMTILI
jgi:hypothetical protein